MLKSIQSQGKLSKELADQIRAANSSKRLEDLYLPYKPKKQTLATAARQKGLEPLAREVLEADPAAANLGERAAAWVNPQLDLHTVDDVLAGVRHIMAEWFSERPDVRGRLRKILHRTGQLVCARVESPRRGAVESEIAAAGEEDVATAENMGECATEPSAEEPLLQAPLATQATVASEAVTVPADQAAEPAGQAILDQECELSHTVESPAADEIVHGTDDVACAGSEASPAANASALDTTTPGVEGSHPEHDPAEASTSSTPVPLAPRRPSKAKKRGPLSAAINEKEKKRQRLEAAFKDYYSFQESITRLPPHRVLAINRGERARILRVKIDGDMEAMASEAEGLLVPEGHVHADFLKGCVRESLSRLVMPGSGS